MAAAVAFAVTLAALALVSRDERRATAGPGPGVATAPRGMATDARITRLQARVAEAPERVDLVAVLAGAYLQKVREAGDFSYYAKADGVLARGLARAPRDAGLLTERGALRLARHDFRGALADGRRARRLAPEVNKPFGVVVDALVELGRYDAAIRVLQAMIDRKPNIDAYARVAYVRELRGDLDGAAEALALADSAGGEVPENTAYVQSLIGNLALQRGQVGAARRAYRTALARVRAYAPAQAGLARAEAAGGDLGRAIGGLRAVVTRLPLPEYVVALGETELAAGRVSSARRDLEIVRAQQQLLAGAGVNTDVEMALYEADHGSPARALRLARAAWRAAPSVRSADALGWALTRAGRGREGLRWARRALATGWREPSVLYHAGMAARSAGRERLARRWLGRALRQSPRFSPLHAPRARRALEAL